MLGFVLISMSVGLVLGIVGWTTTGFWLGLTLYALGGAATLVVLAALRASGARKRVSASRPEDRIVSAR